MISNCIINRPKFLPTGSFHLWGGTLPAKIRINRFLGEIVDRSLLPGFEIHASFTELKNWAQLLRRKDFRLPAPLEFVSRAVSQRILKEHRLTLHVDPLSQLDIGQVDSFVEDIRIVHEILGIEDVTTHPDDCSTSMWESVLASWIPKLALSVENMDPRKSGFQDLMELDLLFNEFPDLKLVFDTCHWIENGRNLKEPALKAFLAKHLKRFTKLHISVPSSDAGFYSARDKSTAFHFLCARSGHIIATDFLDSLPQQIPWVLEGSLATQGLPPLLNEIEYLNRTEIEAIPAVEPVISSVG